MKKFLVLLLAVCLMNAPLVSLAAQTPANRIVVQVDVEPECMDPTLNEFSSGSTVLSNLFTGLMTYDATGAPVPGQAASYTVSDDKLVYTFTLRDDLKFSDGSPLTAQDFYYSWTRTMNPENAAANVYTMYDIKNVLAYTEGTAALEDVGLKVIDDKTLEITLERPAPWILSLLAASDFAAIKQEVADADPNDLQAWTRSVDTYVSTGPFRLKEMQPKARYILEKNPNYYNAENVQIDEVEFVFINAEETALIAYENGEIDVMTTVSAAAREMFADSSNYHATPRPGMRYYHFNTTVEPLTDARVRKALSLAINRQVITEAIRQSGEPPLYAFLPYAIKDLEDPNQSWREVHGDAFAEDVALAQQLLAEAGYPGGEGFPAISIVQRPNKSETDVAEAMQFMWKDNLGVDIEVKTYESGVYWDLCDAGEFEIAFTGFTGDYMDPLALLFKFESKSNRKESRWTNEEYDQIIEQARNSGDATEREALFARAEEILADEFPCMPVYSYIAQYVAHDGIEGLVRPEGRHIRYEFATKTQ